ncbi:MAG: hypothetical protein KZQ56_13680, partial [gamma proteobacterium symbiont of Lucinoma myriamae]|nr:hypothetical protein [gamma proteobacterium symbiont of Lucinoma myriamae]
MDIATVIGVIGALAIIAVAMVLSGGIILFINVPSFLVVYARHGHKLMGCKSPVGGSPLCKLYPTIL